MKLIRQRDTLVIPALLEALERVTDMQPEANLVAVEIEQRVADNHLMLQVTMESAAGRGFHRDPVGVSLVICFDRREDPAQWIEVEGESGEQTVFTPSPATFDQTSVYIAAAVEAVRLLKEAALKR